MSTVPGNYKNDRYTQKNMEKETIYIRTEINKTVKKFLRRKVVPLRDGYEMTNKIDKLVTKKIENAESTSPGMKGELYYRAYRY